MKKLILASAVASMVLATPAIAAPAGPTGTIDLANPIATLSAPGETAWPAYGDSVTFDVTVDGKVSKQAQLYVRVRCEQGSAVVYVWSGAPEFAFPLVDQAGYEWDGGAATCTAELIYRIKHGKSSTISVLDTAFFDVAGA